MRFVRILGGLLATVVAMLLGSEAAIAQQPPTWSELRQRIRLELDNIRGMPGLGRIEAPSPSTPRIRWQSAPAGTLHDTARQLACAQSFSPDLLLGVLETESGVRQDVVGAVGEIGAGQIRGETADLHALSREKLRTSFDYNAVSTISILRSCGVEQNVEHGLRCYNGGPGWQKSPEHIQQKLHRYVQRVLAAQARYRYVRCN